MSNKVEPQTELQDYAGGWITEKKHTGVPQFLKFTYAAVGLGTIFYLVLFIFGETGHAERGSLVEQFNKATETSPGLMYGVAALAAIFFLCVILFAFGNSEKND